MVKNHDRAGILRLLCLLSVSLSGFKKDEFDYIRKAFITCYGFEEIPLMMNLQDAQIIRVRDDRLNWRKAKDTFKLINEDVDMAKPTDISYVFNGLAPMSVKLIEILLGGKGLENFKKCKYIIVFANALHRMQAAESDHLTDTRRRITTFQSGQAGQLELKAQDSSVFPGWHHFCRNLSYSVLEHSIHGQDLHHRYDQHHQRR